MARKHDWLGITALVCAALGFNIFLGLALAQKNSWYAAAAGVWLVVVLVRLRVEKHGKK